LLFRLQEWKGLIRMTMTFVSPKSESSKLLPHKKETRNCIIGQGGCSNQAGGNTLFNNVVFAEGGGGATNSSYACNSSWVYVQTAQGTTGANGSVTNWIYDDLYYSTTTSYIPQNLISNDVQYSQYSLAQGGNGKNGCANSQGEDGFLVIKY